MQVQSVLIPKDWGIRDSEKWLYNHKFKFLKVHTTKHYFRFRQFKPIKGRKYLSKKLKNGVVLVME